jgi:hypothetical protein
MKLLRRGVDISPLESAKSDAQLAMEPPCQESLGGSLLVLFFTYIYSIFAILGPWSIISSCWTWA